MLAPKEMKGCIQKKTFTIMFKAALFTISQNWRQSKCHTSEYIVMWPHCGILLNSKKKRSKEDLYRGSANIGVLRPGLGNNWITCPKY